ncbi:uncharacterized protein LOC121640501 isoform X2 [Melanotaenia boesemani]|uniref:uncharacterized protein LOC121640501 isoform X2 n=1 Tax=Melanotaenia boesemani TaxID=1250792 RepID=UPI001C03F2CA|nr:uncharacterized protein LOC121640501 isoform X2 [Melanotaenia boesemani]
MDTRSSFILSILLPLALCVSADPVSITVNSGDNITLECLVLVSGPLEALMWIRPDYGPLYVFFYRDGRPLESFQHPSFVGRVALRDAEMRDGDVSIILNNVTISDIGTYEGHVAMSSQRKKRAPSELRCSISLKVEDSGVTCDGRNKGSLDLRRLLEDLRVSVPVGLGLLLILVITGICGIRKCPGSKGSSPGGERPETVTTPESELQQPPTPT